MQNPFLGLSPYTEEDGNRLFGRERDLALMRGRVLSRRTTLLFAASGVGKTSFLNAKLMPELASTHTVVTCRNWITSPTEAVLAEISRQIGSRAVTLADTLSRFRKSDESTPPVGQERAPKRCILCLDQFEEALQSYADSEPLSRFLHQLAGVINDDDLRVRVIFSIREEFLGELSVFDALIPDLFANYYRLKYPSREQAYRIVEQTCRLGHKNVDEAGLDLLLGDLWRIRREGRLINAAPEVCISSADLADYVAPPCLQLVCHRLWDNSWDSGAHNFLEDYECGTAIKVLESFCQEKVSALPDKQKDLFSNALEYLITKRGAKMAYESAVLAHVMRANPGHLRPLLEELAREDIRILRKLRRPDGIWFELYHDMYAPFLYRWKEERRRQEQNEIKRKAQEWEKGIPPDEIANWERETTPLSEFWVYLPAFLAAYDAQMEQKIIDVMAHNIAKKGTNYLYIVETNDNVDKLYFLVKQLEARLKPEGVPVRDKVRVLLLRGSGNNGIADAVSALLHLGNCWIAVKGKDAEGYEVSWSRDGREVKGGRRLPTQKLNRIVENLSKIMRHCKPATFADTSHGEAVDKVIKFSPTILVHVPDEATSRAQAVP